MQAPNKPISPDTTDKLIAYLFTFIGIVALLIIRGALYYHEWGDFSHFLQPWMFEYREMTFLEGLRTKVGNYNHSYMYILNMISRLEFTGLQDVWLVKTVSVLFDFLLAFFVMKIVSLKTSSLNTKILAFLLTFAIPTVVLNSSMWGQCDSIYASLAIGSVYFGLTGRSKSSYALMGLAISFKMQAVFLLPMLVILILRNRMSLKHCYIFFLTFIATLLPALIAGMPFDDVFLVYFRQANYFDSLNMNLANVWRFTPWFYLEYEEFRLAGLFVAGLAVLGLMYFTYVNRSRLVHNIDYIRLAYLFAIIMPFLLPKMHDRYYFIADVLSLVVFLFDKRRWYVPLVTIFTSFVGYVYFLMYAHTVIDYIYPALALLVIIIIVRRDYVISLRSEEASQD